VRLRVYVGKLKGEISGWREYGIGSDEGVYDLGEDVGDCRYVGRTGKF